MSHKLSRRRFVTGLTMATVCSSSVFAKKDKAKNTNYLDENVLANSLVNQTHLYGNNFELTIGYSPVNFVGRDRLATTVNNSLPAPVLHWKEGERVTIKVKNHLSSDTSIHWHGMILPTNMDGVPGLSFDGIKPGEFYEYSFDVKQNGTYWYHSHSGHQEQTGLYGAIVIHPKENDPVSYDRDYVVMLSDWSDENPHDVYRNLKIMPHYYNTNERTVKDLYQDIKEKGVKETWGDRSMWNRMRMSDRDISDVTGYSYTFLMNGQTPAEGWFGEFRKGEKIRLRFINAAAMTFFDVRIPDLKMKVVASDGQNIDPVSVDEFRIGVAETYDVVVEPESDSAYTIFAQAMDRSGYARGTLATDSSVKAFIPEMDPSPILSHADMGMSHSEMNHGSMNSGGMDHQGMDHGSMNHNDMNSAEKEIEMGSGQLGFGSSEKIIHPATEFGPNVDMRVAMPQYALDDPGVGLRDHQIKYNRKVLTYADLCNYKKTPDPREPSREIQLHLSGNMHRYMWSFDGVKFADAEPLELFYGERIRITLVNDTMMNHPIHLHGMWSDLETGDPEYIPRKHTIIVQPGTKISYLVTVDAKGRWAYHCHLLYHMMGMFREVLVK